MDNKKDSETSGYQTELKRISLISETFSAFVSDVVKNYPSDKTRKLQAASDLITEIIKSNESVNLTERDKVEKIYRIADSFGPYAETKKREVENSFNLDEVLNPKKDLDLMQLCKELGVTD